MQPVITSHLHCIFHPAGTLVQVGDFKQEDTKSEKAPKGQSSCLPWCPSYLGAALDVILNQRSPAAAFYTPARKPHTTSIKASSASAVKTAPLTRSTVPLVPKQGDVLSDIATIMCKNTCCLL